MIPRFWGLLWVRFPMLSLKASSLTWLKVKWMPPLPPPMAARHRQQHTDNSPSSHPHSSATIFVYLWDVWHNCLVLGLWIPKKSLVRKHPISVFGYIIVIFSCLFPTLSLGEELRCKLQLLAKVNVGHLILINNANNVFLIIIEALIYFILKTLFFRAVLCS